MATHTYRFSEFQAGLVESGEKTMTIRAPRKAPSSARTKRTSRKCSKAWLALAMRFG
jgi:hypothetical protein